MEKRSTSRKRALGKRAKGKQRRERSDNGGANLLYTQMYSMIVNGGSASGSSAEKENAFGEEGGEGVGEIDGEEVGDLDDDEEAEEWDE